MLPPFIKNIDTPKFEILENTPLRPVGYNVFNNNTKNNKHICKAPLGRSFRGAGDSRLCVLVKEPYTK